MDEKEEVLTVHERDENGFPATVYSGLSTNDYTYRRIGRKESSWSSTTEVLQSLINVFLPTGYPNSVSPDYIDYQIYDSIQAFSSSIASLFANRAVLSAVGVGDESATSTSALFMKIIQETVGRLGTILFAWKLGSALEPEAKKYRYVADLVNDSAIVFDCMSPMFPGSKNTKIILLCMSGLLRSICGVMAGGSRAALTLHFTDPLKGSIADVNAKDQSQETVITLMGMLTGSIVVGAVKGEGFGMWVTVLLLLALHLWTNYQAVSSVIIRVLNRQRTNIVFSDIVCSLPEFQRAYSTNANGAQAMSRLVLTPRKTAAKERILESDGLLRWYTSVSTAKTTHDRVVGRARFGPFRAVLESQRKTSKTTNFEELFAASDTLKSGYVLGYEVDACTGDVLVTICLVSDHSLAGNADLRAWAHALLVAVNINPKTTTSQYTSPMDVIVETRKIVSKLFDDLDVAGALKAAGWELDKSAIQPGPNCSIRIANLASPKAEV
ncbi:hypothetical protein TRVA0_011S03158 [Trichomonascus vanleenenianus]|uniref:RUS1 family protein n=1 Tax=Trichomonascus vanleenenianus TaxID=2268995 RepID=UPI003ECB3FE5